MKMELLGGLVCPQCSSHLSPEVVLEKNGEEIVHGTVRCRCAEYPIVSGILVLKKDSRTRAATSLLRKGQIVDSLNVLAEARFTSPTYRAISRVLRIPIPSMTTRIYRILLKGDLLSQCQASTFLDTIERLRWGLWAEDLRYRFSTPDFVGAVALMQLIGRSNKLTLDLGCGTGHSSYILSGKVPERTIVCADLLFVHLYLAKRFFVGSAQFICLDVNKPLPFQKGTFSNVLCLQMFHYVKSQPFLAKELVRVLDEAGILILSHLHNRLVNREREYRGHALTPQEYITLFSSLRTRLLPEDTVVLNFVRKGQFDLSTSMDLPTLNKCDTLTLVGSADPNVFKPYRNLDYALMRTPRRLVVNPIYTLQKEGDRCLLQLKTVSEELRRMYRLFDSFMPKRIQVRTDILAQALSATTKIDQQSEIQDLVRRFVLIDAPRNYAS
jgi:SAM-dependent methyltransferase/uncharacterized protein YbaR (Trm112 family)